MSKNSIRIPPFYFIHILDRNSNITRLEIGPQTFIVQDHEMVATGEKPLKMIVLQPNTYCEITNPVIRNAKGELSTDKFGQVNLRYGETEYRFYQTYPEPFPLYPRETLSLVPTKLRIVKELNALKIEATRNFKSPSGIERKVGDVWLFEGPNTYIPRVEERIVDEIRAQIIGESQALKLRALETFTDRKGIKRKAGEEWLIREPGSYLAGVYETIVELQNPFILTDGQAIHLRAVQNFIDAYKKERKAGEEWLVTLREASFHVLDIFEEFVGIVKLTILRSAQFCVVLNPYDPVTGKNHYGTRELRKGTCSFFLQPGESLDAGVKDIYILQEDEALLLHALEAVDDKKPGDRWMVHGPGRYIPPVKVEVLDKRKVIPLDKNEGIYVKDIRTGKVRMEIGQSYMLKAHEELFLMELDELTEKILAKDRTEKGERLKYKVVTNRVPYNAAVQIYNFKKKTTNVVFGPNLVMLGPDEQFTVCVFSGGFPKKPGVLKKINVDLGPVFSTDLVAVETSDHATLNLQLSYNWHFRVNKEDPVEAAKIFSVKDFMGDLCNTMASIIRGAVAGVDFDTFHKTSARLIRKSVFGVDEEGKIKGEYFLDKNNAVITSVDIQSVEPVDTNTKENLQKTVALAIEITTKRQEAFAKHNAEKLDQEACGELQKMMIEDQSKAESARKDLLELQARSESVKIQGVAIAESKAKAEANEIYFQSKLRNIQLSTKAKQILSDANLARDVRKRNLELEHEKSMHTVEIDKSRKLAEIESNKFEEMVKAIGRETVVAIAKAGPEMEAELLSGLGLQGFIMTDGNNPINLFNTASGLIGTKPEN